MKLIAKGSNLRPEMSDLISKKTRLSMQVEILTGQLFNN
jgi:hypothetical protein